MKKLIFLISIIAIAFSLTAQDFTFTKPGVKQIITASVLTSAGADTIDIMIKTINGEQLDYSIHTIATNNSGTTEAWPLVYVSNSDDAIDELATTKWVAIAAVQGDTLVSGTMFVVKQDTDGFNYQYLRFIVKAKTATQNTTIDSWMYVSKGHD